MQRVSKSEAATYDHAYVPTYLRESPTKIGAVYERIVICIITYVPCIGNSHEPHPMHTRKTDRLANGFAQNASQREWNKTYSPRDKIRVLTSGLKNGEKRNFELYSIITSITHF